jgi:hypothetical protein
MQDDTNIKIIISFGVKIYNEIDKLKPKMVMAKSYQQKYPEKFSEFCTDEIHKHRNSAILFFL